MVITNLMTGSESAFHTYFLVSIFNSNYYIIAFLSGFLFCIIQREFRVVIDKQWVSELRSYNERVAILLLRF